MDTDLYSMDCPTCGAAITYTSRCADDNLAETGCADGHRFPRSEVYKAHAAKTQKESRAKFYSDLRADLGQGPIRLNAAARLRASAIHPEVQACVDSVMKLMRKTFPKAVKTFKGYKFERVNHPSYDAWDRDVKIPLFGKDRPLVEVDREEDASDKSVLHYGFEGMLIHEFGHHIDHFIRAKGDGAIKDLWFDEKRRLQRELGNVSAYAATNASEWVAEEFLAEIKRRRSPELLNVINKIMETL
jgi:hypothetical protein